MNAIARNINMFINKNIWSNKTDDIIFISILAF